LPRPSAPPARWPASRCRLQSFSLSWSRIFPEGAGKPDEAGLAYYQRLIDELLRNGIEPYVTLFHWDLPQALEGGWQSRDTPKAFADYAAYAARKLSDRVRHFMTTNEVVCFTDLSYQVGQFAPGLKIACRASQSNPPSRRCFCATT
jgi:beta-glucosidase